MFHLPKRFRWCRTVPCRSAEVNLILTSVTGTQFILTWKSDLGWYESDVVFLPCGLHTGIIHIKSKTSDGSQKFRQFEKPHERDYKVDPFFISPHKLAVELFLANENVHAFWNEIPELRQRYFSSQQLPCQSYQKEEVPRRLYRSNDELCYKPSKICFPQSLDEQVSYFSAQKLDDWGLENQLQNVGFSEKYSRWTSQGSSSGLGFQEEVEQRQVDHSSNNNSASKDTEKFTVTSPDSSYHSRSQSFQMDLESSEGFPADHVEHPKKILSSRSFESSKDNEVLEDRRTQSARVSSALSLEAIDSMSSARKKTLKTELNLLHNNLLSQIKAVEPLLKSSDSEEEEEERKKCNYGCVITFESRSESMDDLGSPRALEEVLVSIASSEAEEKRNSLLNILHNNSSDSSSINHESLNVTDFVSEEADKKSPSSGTPVPEESGQKCLLDLDDDDFPYESLKQDGPYLPIDISNIDSEDSLHEKKNLIKMPGMEPIQERDIREHTKEGVDSQSSSDSSNSADRVGSYDIHLSSAVRKPLDDVHPLSFIHPDLLSEPVNHNLLESKISALSRKIRSEQSRKQVSSKNSNHVLHVENGYDAGESENDKSVTDLLKDDVRLQEDSLHVRPSQQVGSAAKIRSLQSKIGDYQRLLRSNVNQRPFSSQGPLAGSSDRHRIDIYGKKHKISSTVFGPPLPDKINGPWTQKTSKIGEESPSYVKPKLATLQRNLYNLVCADRMLTNVFHERHKNNLNVFDISGDHSTPGHAHYPTCLNYSQPRLAPFGNSSERRLASESKTVLFEGAGKLYDDYRILSTRPVLPLTLFSDAGETKARDHASISRLSFSRHASLGKFHRASLGASLHLHKGVSRAFGGGIPSSSSLPDMRGIGSYPSTRFCSPFLQSPTFSSLVKTTPLYKVAAAHQSSSTFMEGDDSLGYSSGSSTDSLIDEAKMAVENSLYISEIQLQPELVYRRKKKKRRSKSSFTSFGKTLIFSQSLPQSRTLLGSSCISRSETDLRRSSGRRQGATRCVRIHTKLDPSSRRIQHYRAADLIQRPYLPYKCEELTVGQIVKVLIPGGGVAPARVVYAPTTVFSRDKMSPEVTVLLLSEPNKYSGTLLNLTMDRVLLAWPKK